MFKQDEMNILTNNEIDQNGSVIISKLKLLKT